MYIAPMILIGNWTAGIAAERKAQKTAQRMEASEKPIRIPISKGSVFRNPTPAAQLIAMILLGPGVMAETTAYPRNGAHGNKESPRRRENSPVQLCKLLSYTRGNSPACISYHIYMEDEIQPR